MDRQGYIICGAILLLGFGFVIGSWIYQENHEQTRHETQMEAMSVLYDKLQNIEDKQAKLEKDLTTVLVAQAITFNAMKQIEGDLEALSKLEWVKDDRIAANLAAIAETYLDIVNGGPVVKPED